MIEVPDWLFKMEDLQPDEKWLYLCLLHRNDNGKHPLVISRQDLAVFSGVHYLEVFDRLRKLEEQSLIQVQRQLSPGKETFTVTFSREAE